MGTTQDYEVAVEEGATIVRLGSVLYELSQSRIARESCAPCHASGGSPSSSIDELGAAAAARVFLGHRAADGVGSDSSRLPTTSAGTLDLREPVEPVEGRRARHDPHGVGERLGMAVALDPLARELEHRLAPALVGGRLEHAHEPVRAVGLEARREPVPVGEIGTRPDRAGRSRRA